MTEMTPAALVELCKKNGGYRQPHLNDQLYLQLQGFRKIQNLEPYKNVKAIWLDQNAISEVTGLSHMLELCTLFLQHNFICRINSRSFEGLANLRILDLSNNHLTKISGLQHTPLLETLQLTHNRFESLAAVRGIMVCKKLSCVDLSFNLIECVGSAETEKLSDDDETSTPASAAAAAAGGASESNDAANEGDDAYGNNDDAGGEAASSKAGAANEEKDQLHIMTDNSDCLVAFWQQLPELGVLYLYGNELPRKCKFYRKRMICGIPSLSYLDEKPIFPDERRTVEAWGRGGPEAEEQERTLIRNAKVAEQEKCYRALIDKKDERREIREKAEAERLARMEEAAAWRADMQLVWAREQTEIDHEEYEYRAVLADEEEMSYRREIERIASQSQAAARLGEERVRIGNTLMLERTAEAGSIEKLMHKERAVIRARHDEMKRLIDVFKNDTSIFPKTETDLLIAADDEKQARLGNKSDKEDDDAATKATEFMTMKKDAQGLLNMLSSSSSSSSVPAEKKSAATGAAPGANAAASSVATPWNNNVAASASADAAKKKSVTQHWDAFLDMESRNGKKRRW